MATHILHRSVVQHLPRRHCMSGKDLRETVGLPEPVNDNGTLYGIN